MDYRVNSFDIDGSAILLRDSVLEKRVDTLQKEKMGVFEPVYPIEIKKSHTPDKSCIKNFSLLHKSKVKTGNGIVICDRNDCMPIDSENMMIPVEII